MKSKHIFMLIVVIFVLIIVVNYFTKAQKEKDTGEYDIPEYVTDQETEMTTQTSQESYKGFYEVPGYLWPKITIGGTVSAVIVYVAIVFGIASYIIGSFAGGKYGKRKIFASIGMATAVGIFGRSFTILIKLQLYYFFESIFQEKKLIAGTLADIIIYVIWTVFIAGISVYFYETFTVTAEEAHPVK